MNYIELINNFWAIDLESTFSHAEVHLFFKLMEINNRLGWKNEFKYPNARLEGETGMRSKTLINTRQRLVDCGVLFYKKGNTRNAGTYSFTNCKQPTKESNQESIKETNQPIELTKESNQESIKETNQPIELTKESNQESNQGNNREVIGGVIGGTLTKQNKTKIKKEIKEKFSFRNSMIEYGFEAVVVDEWMNIRKSKKAVNSEFAFKGFISQIEKAKQDKNELLKYIAVKQWCGFEAKWLENDRNFMKNESSKRNFERKSHSSERL